MFTSTRTTAEKTSILSRIEIKRKNRGLSLIDACDSEGITTSTYYNWKKEFPTLFSDKQTTEEAEGTETEKVSKDYEATIRSLKGQIRGLKKQLEAAQENIDDLEAMIADMAIEKFDPFKFNVNKMVAGTLLEHWRNGREQEPDGTEETYEDE